jgi:hypothetical protein
MIQETEEKEEQYTDPNESGLRSGKGPSFLARLFGKF